MNLGQKDNEKIKKIFDNAIINKKYDVIRFYVWELPYKIEFTCAGMIQLDYDLNGKGINTKKFIKIKIQF